MSGGNNSGTSNPTHRTIPGERLGTAHARGGLREMEEHRESTDTSAVRSVAELFTRGTCMATHEPTNATQHLAVHKRCNNTG